MVYLQEEQLHYSQVHYLLSWRHQDSAQYLQTLPVASPQVIRHSKRMVARDFSGASFTTALRYKDAAYAVKLAESLLASAPLVGHAAVEAYARAKEEMPNDDEGRMIELVSRPK